MNETHLLINGAKSGASNEATFDCLNPVTGEVATRAPACTKEDAIRAVEAAGQAFPQWSATTPAGTAQLPAGSGSRLGQSQTGLG